MKEYYIDKSKSYLENRERLVEEGHVMGIHYLPFTYNSLPTKQLVKDVYSCAKDANNRQVHHLEIIENARKHNLKVINYDC